MILLDTSFLIAYEVDTDINHENAVPLMERVVKNEFGMALISDYIFDETVTVALNKTKDLNKAVLIGTTLRNSSITSKINDIDFEETWEIFKAQKNTKLSFTDCTSLAVMKRMNIRNIATFDQDFKKIKWITVVS